MTKNEMENYLRENSYEDYEKVKCEFTFAKKRYKAQVNFAYLNGELDKVFEKYTLDYDKSWMVKDVLSVKNYGKYMDKIVRDLYDKGYSIEISQCIIMDIHRVFNRVIILLDSGKKIDHDLSLVNICNAMAKDKKMYDLLMTNHFNADMTPEEISDKKKWIAQEIKKVDIPGISSLLRSGGGIKEDQLINMFFGRALRVKPNKALNEIYPRFFPERWVDGLETRDSLFAEHSIQRLSAILNSQTMKESGMHNKLSSILGQDCEVIMEDCGTKAYVEYQIEDEEDLKSIEFKYRFEGDELVECTLDDKQLIGTTVKLRSAMKCNAPDKHVCAKCFGANAKWNLSTDEYRYDVGFVSARYVNSAESQKVLSVKHSSTPVLVRAKFTLIDVFSGEYVAENADDIPWLFHRRFNFLEFDRNKWDISFEFKDVVKPTKAKPKPGRFPNLNIFDNEFDEWDIIRVERIYINSTTSKKQSYILEMNSPIRIKGFGRDVTETWWRDVEIIDVPNDPKYVISYVIKNSEHVMSFNKLKEIYTSYKTENVVNALKEKGYSQKEIEKDWEYNHGIEQMYKTIKTVVKGKPVVAFELSLKNKVVSKEEGVNTKPFWEADTKYRIITAHLAIRYRESLSAVLPRGRVYDNLTRIANHDPEKLKYSAFDLLYNDSESDE